MRTRLNRWKEVFDTRLWIVPTCAAVVATAAAKGLPLVDRRLPDDLQAWYLFAGQPGSARELLSTIASSLLTFTGLVFTVSVLVLQQASNQFSPRTLRTFLQDRHTRVAMGTFIGAFVYALALLPEVRDAWGDHPAFVPGISVFVAFALVLVSVGVFVGYIDHMAQSIRAVRVLRRVAREAYEVIEAQYPERSGAAEVKPLKVPAQAPIQQVVNRGQGGVVLGVDDDALLELAKGKAATIALVTEVGEFVPRGAPYLAVWGPVELDEGVLEQQVLLGEERTPRQDVAFGFRQLVDIAVKALSPGINDPTTAVQALDQLHDLLRALARRAFPDVVRKDDEGTVRVLVPTTDWDTFVRLAFDEVRHYGASAPQVVARLRAILEDLLEVAPPPRRHALRDQLDRLPSMREVAQPGA